MCSECFGFYQGSTMWKHKLQCTAITTVAVPDSVTVTVRSNVEDFSQKILGRFHNDGPGCLCATDDMI